MPDRNLDIIRDPITGQQYARDLAIPGSTYASYTPPTPVRNIQFEGGQPGEVLRQGQEQAGRLADFIPERITSYTHFGAVLLHLLNRAQQASAVRFKEQQFQTEAERRQAVGAVGQEFVGFSPEERRAVRTAREAEFQPTIEGARLGERTFTEQLANVKESIGALSDFVKSVEDREFREREFEAEQAYRKESLAIERARLARGGELPGDYKLFLLAQKNPEFAKFLKGFKPPTEAQSQSSGFASRVVASNQIFDKLSSRITKLSPAKYKLERLKPNFLKSAEVQQQEQAERDFINAVLRRESGAAISESEFENARLQYFLQPGDSKQVLEQKRQNRKRVEQSLINAAGPAWEQVVSDPLGIR